MNGKERILAAVRGLPCDRVPVDLGSTLVTALHPRPHRELRRLLGLPERRPRALHLIQGIVECEPDLVEALDVDAVALEASFADGDEDRWIAVEWEDGREMEIRAEQMPERSPDGWVLREFGRVTQIRRPGRRFFERVHSPLAACRSPREVEAFPWDSLLLDEGELARRARRAERARRGQSRAVVAHFGGSVLETLQGLRGFDDLLCDLVGDPPMAEAMIRCLGAVHEENLRRWLRVVGPHVDVVELADDLGTQFGPQMDLATYRAMLRPVLARLFALVREAKGPGLFFHSCGSVALFLDDLVEDGVEALNPIQCSAWDMERESLQARRGDRISFWGGAADPQGALARGTTEALRRECRENLAVFTRGGGLVFAPVHNVLPEVSGEKVLAMVREAQAFRV